MNTTLTSQQSAIDEFNRMVESVKNENPEQAYIFCNRFKKEVEKHEKATKDEFVSYVQKFGNALPWGFTAKITTRKAYSFDQNEEWAKKNAELDDIESKLKRATDVFYDTGVAMVNLDTWEVLPTVERSSTEVYSITK